jgi:hypothetical protein
MSLQRWKREVLRNVVNLPCVCEHVCSNWGVGGAVRSWGLPLVSAGISQVQSGTRARLIFTELCLQHCHSSLLEETPPSDFEV